MNKQQTLKKRFNEELTYLLGKYANKGFVVVVHTHFVDIDKVRKKWKEIERNVKTLDKSNANRSRK